MRVRGRVAGPGRARRPRRAVGPGAGPRACRPVGIGRFGGGRRSGPVRSGRGRSRPGRSRPGRRPRRDAPLVHPQMQGRQVEERSRHATGGTGADDQDPHRREPLVERPVGAVVGRGWSSRCGRARAAVTGSSSGGARASPGPGTTRTPATGTALEQPVYRPSASSGASSTACRKTRRGPPPGTPRAASSARRRSHRPGQGAVLTAVVARKGRDRTLAQTVR